MKFSPEVLAALQTLKNAAESDFERHRISVLENDLTNPPVVEVIDDSHQKFDGIVYSQKKDGHFHGYISIQRAIYSYYYGKIPAGYLIHHINENKTNNDISNLQMLSAAEHQKIHSISSTGAFAKMPSRCEYCGKEIEVYIRQSNKHHFCNEKCKSAFYYRCKQNEISLLCNYCGKDFTSNKYANKKYCSRDCANKATGKNRKS